MSTGSFGLWLMLAGVGLVDAPTALPDRTVAIPYSLKADANEVSEAILYVSIDQGRVWSRAGVIKPNERYFSYQAPTDGIYWFNIAVMYKNGTQVPADFSQMPPQQKVLFDTVRPVVRLVSAERVGDEIVVTWDVQENNPDLTKLKLEYRPADAATNAGYVVPVNPGLAGMGRFRPTVAGPVVVRVSIFDTAGNAGFAERLVTAPAVAIEGVNPVATEAIKRTTAFNNVPGTLTNQTMPVEAPVQALTPPPPEQMQPLPGRTPLASSRPMERSREPAVPAATTTTSARTDLPKVHHTNEPQVTIDYEIEHQGPSGVSKVEVYLTRDDGRSWMKWQDLTRNSDNGTGNLPATNVLPVTLRFPENEGLFGFRIVPYSGTQLSSGVPQTGDAPEVRLQFDKTAPFVEMYQPDTDPQDSNILMLNWKASDTFLTDHPIHVYWSESPNTDWKSVSVGPDTGLPNTGRHAWTLPPNMPLKVYLKITAEDKAGNIGEAITPQPIMVDLHKPAGRVKGIAVKPKTN